MASTNLTIKTTPTGVTSFLTGREERLLKSGKLIAKKNKKSLKQWNAEKQKKDEDKKNAPKFPKVFFVSNTNIFNNFFCFSVYCQTEAEKR